LTTEQRSAFEIDAAVMADIFIMDADGSNVRQLTDELGYDGGPFFSPDGQKICYRHFEVNGAIAEIWTMDLDGSNKKQLTRLDAMSWAPYFHPSGDYLIFTTNKHGFSNFELYLVDAAGESQPVRVTTTEGFDALASFSPDGKTLTWTSNRTSNKSSQIFLANWDHAAACQALGIDSTVTAGIDPEALQSAEANAALTAPDFNGLDLMKHVDFLCRPSLAGRMTGSSGESKATAYVHVHFDILGLQPAGDNGTWLQEFDFPAGAKLGPKNRFASGEKAYELDKDWRPLAFSRAGTIDPTPVVFAGYGICAPKDDHNNEYDSYVHLDVKDKWVLMFRYVPENTSDKQRQQLQYHSSLRKKAMDARDKGAKGIIVISGPTSMAREQLVPLENDFSMSVSSMAAICVTDDVAAAWLKSAGHDLKALQEKLDSGSPSMGFELAGIKVAADIEIELTVGKGHNVLGRLQAGDKPSETAILVGAHIDHLGSGRSGSSLARDDESTYIHFGADDNASGVAAMLEIAEYLAKQKKAGKLSLQRDVIFAGWSGEELGLIGSQHFVQSVQRQLSKTESTASANRTQTANPHASAANESATVEAKGRPNIAIYPAIGACLNMDMVGRYDGKLILQGIGSSGYWTKAAEKNATIGLNLKLSNDTNLPTDASSFYRAGVPILSAFTGSHTDYHTPRDTPEKLNYEDAARIAKLMGLIARSLATEKELPNYLESKGEVAVQPRANMRAYLGSLPEYGADVKGVLLGSVTKDSPIEKAGVKGGDVIVELGGRKVESVQEYVFAIEALKIGQETSVVVMRDDQRIELKVTPGRR
jgi:Zn-dependent M28 family amino/carboxypeptidase